MEKYEAHLPGDFEELLGKINEEFIKLSSNKSEYHSGDFRCAVCVYEKYSWWHRSFISLTVLMVQNEKELFVSAMYSGGDLTGPGNAHNKLLSRVVKVIEEYKRAEQTL